MNTNIVISLDDRRAKKDGTFPLVMRLGHNERTTSISLGISIFSKDWDGKNRRIKKSYSGVSSVSHLNNLIAKKKSEAMDVIFKLNEDGVLASLPIAVLKKHIVASNETNSFFDYTAKLIDELLKSNRVGTARSYRDASNVIKSFVRGKDLRFEEITYDFLRRFEAYHLAKGNSYNGLSVYLRAVRSIYNQAIKSGLVDKALYPFADYKIKSVPTQKRALDFDVLSKIIELELPPAHPCFHARNYFVASYMMYGMNFTDMAFLKWSDLKNGRVQYRRRKTSKIYDIKITESLNSIFEFYRGFNKGFDGGNEYVFPIVKRETALLQSKDIHCARKRYNKKLKAIAEMCGIEEVLTSYVSRHSFATQAMMKEVPIKVISTMLGHSNLKTTEIYLKSLPSNVLDDYNEKILGS